MNATISIRPAPSADTAVERLAQLDSRPSFAGPALVAEVDGEPRAALSLRDGGVVADPFAPTSELVGLLRMRAGGHGRRGGHSLARRRLVPRTRAA